MDNVSFHSDTPSVWAKCGRCGRDVEVAGFTQDLASDLNRLANAAGIEPLGINELALCSCCEPQWQAERSDYQARYMSRRSEAWRRYKHAVRAHVEKGASKHDAIDKVSKLLPTALLDDADFSGLRVAWNRWFIDHREERKKGDF